MAWLSWPLVVVAVFTGPFLYALLYGYCYRKGMLIEEIDLGYNPELTISRDLLLIPAFGTFVALVFLIFILDELPKKFGRKADQILRNRKKELQDKERARQLALLYPDSVGSLSIAVGEQKRAPVEERVPLTAREYFGAQTCNNL